MFDYGCEEYNSTLLENVSMTATVVVYDAIMGTGKSTAIIDKFNKLVEEGDQHAAPYLVILPLLSEVKRYQKDCPGMSFQQPLSDKERASRCKTEPACNRGPNGATTKGEDLKILLANGYNILTTHSLFGLWDDEIALAVRAGGYHVILDEEVGSMKGLSLNLKPGDRRELQELGYLSIDEDTRKVSWDFEKSDDKDGRYTGNVKYKIIRNCCKAGNLYIYGELDDARIPFFIWTMPGQFFGVAKSYTILTYRFESSELAAFFRLNKVEFKIEKPNLDRQLSIMRNAKDLISFIDAPKRVMTETAFNTSLSQRWYTDATSPVMSKMRKSIGDSLKNTHKVPPENLLWTCPSAYSKTTDKNKGRHMGIRGYVDNEQHVAWNCRGTNDYANTNVIVYLINVYPHVGIVKHLSKKGISFDQGAYALSFLLQFVWRSAIRNGEPIQLMIPNPRMRKLFKDWLRDI